MLRSFQRKENSREKELQDQMPYNRAHDMFKEQKEGQYGRNAESRGRKYEDQRKCLLMEG